MDIKNKICERTQLQQRKSIVFGRKESTITRQYQNIIPLLPVRNTRYGNLPYKFTGRILLCLFCNRIFTIRERNSGFPIKYRFHNLRGSCVSRNNHSNPCSLSQSGHRWSLPDKVSRNPPPIQIIFAFSLSRSA